MSYDIPIINGNPCRGAIRADAAINRTPDVPTLGPSVNVGTPPTSGLLVITGGQVFARPSNYYPHPPTFDVVPIPNVVSDPNAVGVLSCNFGGSGPEVLSFTIDGLVDTFDVNLPWCYVLCNGQKFILSEPETFAGPLIQKTISLPSVGDVYYQFVFPNAITLQAGKYFRYNTWALAPRAP